MKISLWCCENQPVILVKSDCDFGKVGVWFWIDKFLLNIRLYHKSFYIHYLIQYLLFFYLPGVILHKLKGWWQDGMRRDCLRFMTRLNETGLHPFFDKMVWDRTAFILWQDCMRQDCIHFYDKIVWDRTAFIFMTRWHETGLHPFLWQDCMRQDCIHFYDKIVWDRTASIFMTRWQKTGTHPFFLTSHHNTGTLPFWWQASIRPVLIHFYDKPA